MANSSGSSPGFTNVTPFAGYELQNNCSSGAPSFGSTNAAWANHTVDLTDAYTSGFTYLNFQSSNAPNTNVTPAAQPAAWVLDDIWVRSLGTPSFNGATTNIVIQPGAPTKVQFTPQTADSLVYGACLSGQSFQIGLQYLDQFGNGALGQPIIEIDWTESANSVQPSYNITGATVTGLLANGVQLQMKQSQILIAIPDNVNETLTFSINPLATGLAAGDPVTLTTPLFVCHNTGVSGTQYSDTTGTGTINVTQATHACETVYGRGKCASNANYVYPNVTGGSCRAGSTYSWIYSAYNPTAPGGCGNTTFLNQGRVIQINDYDPSSATCVCSPSIGQTSNIQYSGSGTTWN